MLPYMFGTDPPNASIELDLVPVLIIVHKPFSDDFDFSLIVEVLQYHASTGRTRH